MILKTEHYTWKDQTIALFVPTQEGIQSDYLRKQQSSAEAAFPYWSKIWPSAIALCRFIADRPELIKDKQVLELAGGLGLPSLLAARFAHTVCYSDYLPEPLEIVQQSILLNSSSNITCVQLDWARLPENLTAEVLLLSDINYDPSEFDVLFEVFMRFLNGGTTIMLSTPQRLMSKPFIGKLLPWCVEQKEITVRKDNAATMITVMVFSLK